MLKELFEWTQDHLSMNDVFVSKIECAEDRAALKDRFEKVITIPGIRTFHAAVPLNNTTICMKIVSSANTSSFFALVSNKRKAEKQDFKTKCTRKKNRR